LLCGIRALAQSEKGIHETELFDPGSGRFTAGPMLDPAWFNVTATLLGNGKVLLFGGETALGERQASLAVRVRAAPVARLNPVANEARVEDSW
jgi:hypothetical protein